MPASAGGVAPARMPAPQLFRTTLQNFQWLEGGRYFGYSVQTGPEAWEYWLVDAVTGEKRRLADTAALKMAWRQPEAMPAVDDVLFWSSGSLCLKSAGRWWCYQPEPAPSLAEAASLPVTPAVSPVLQPLPAAQLHPPVSPDGQFRAFVKEGNVWGYDRVRNETFALTSDGKPGDAYEWPGCWSGDSRHLLVYKVRRPPVRRIALVESSPKGETQPLLHWIDYNKPGDPLPEPQPWLFDIATRQGRPVDMAGLCPNPWSLSPPQWNQALGCFTCVYNQRGHQVLRLLGIDPLGGRATSLLEEESRTFIDYSGKFYCRLLASGEILWMSERSGWNHLWLRDPKAKRMTHITSGEWVVDKVVHVDEASRQLWFWGCGFVAGENPYDRQLFRVNFDGSGLVRLTEGRGDHDFVAFAPEFRSLLVRWSRPDQPPVHELRDGQTGRLICTLETGEVRGMTATGWLPEPFSAKGRDGQTDIWGLLYRPALFDPHRRYPVIESIYAGPHGHFAATTFRLNGREQELANRGFIVVRIDGMGTSGRAKAFQDVSWQNLRDAGFPDRKLWIQSAARHCPQMDLERVGIYGGSAGGQNAMRALLDHYPFYKVAVADCGCHDNRMDKIWWNEQFLGWPVGEQYVRNSNVVDAGKLQGKLLLIVGEMDSNVDPASTLQVANALIQAQKPFDLLVIPGGGHCCGENTPYGWSRLQDYFLRNL